MKINEFAKYVLIGFGALMVGQTGFSNQLDTDSATVSLSVGKYAEITGLDDFALSLTTGADGAMGSEYGGSDQFSVESNCPILVAVTGTDLAMGSNSISTSYKLDGEDSFQTLGMHNSSHTISATAELGNVSSQEAGAYSSEVTITVSAI